MIRINLLPGPKKRGGAGAGFSLGGLKGIVEQVKDPLLLGVAGSWAVGLLVVGFLYVTQTARLGALESRHTEIEAEARRFRALMVQKRRAEELRDSLVTELNAIRSIDADRYIWPHIFEEISKALPDFTWLVGIDHLAPSTAATAVTDSVSPPVRFQVDGRTSDISAYTRFVRQLTNSPWIGNVEFGPAQSVIEDDRPITAFTITVTFRQADSAFIRTVPVLESVR